MTPAAEAGAASRRLILTADDFGLSADVNEAVVRGCRDGVLRFASLMVAAPAADEAVERARRECPRLGLGLHAVLCSGRAVLPPAELGGLVDADGRFVDDPVVCGMRAFFDRGLSGALERELRAQFERFLGFGLPPGHVDGHANVHAHPVVFPMLVRLAREYGFTRIRLPGGELAASLRFSWGHLGKQLREAGIFFALRAYLTRGWADPNVAVADRTYGLLRSGMMTEAYLLSALETIPKGLTEMYFHPTADASTAVDDHPRPGHRTVSDLDALLSPRVRARIEELGIELVTAR
ncbi:MAG: hopanoid biosynthesis-associated protein HpnK [Elusimicrobia bacterium]|nr:hopanoid biosynthesis-associated protein HpnK [Elusimicrobiota bacterium]